MTTLHKQFNKEVLPFFELPIKLDLLRFNIQDNWLSVYVKENLNSQGQDIKYKLVCAQSLTDYMFTIDETDTLLTRAIINRITLMLAETLRSALQDINILYENKKTWN